MAFNVLGTLQALANPSAGFASPMMGGVQPPMFGGRDENTVYAPEAEAPMSFQAAPGAGDSNILQRIAGGGINPQTISEGPLQLPGMGAVDTSVAPAPQVQAKPQRSPRDRRSVIDIIGGLADTFATVGGAAPLYQPTLDAREGRQMMRADREMAIEDRDRQIDLDGLNRRILEQRLTSGEIEIGDAQREMVGQAASGLRNVFGKYGVEGVKRAWPLLSQQLQIPPERAQAIGQALEANPEETIRALESVIGDDGQGGYGLQPFYATDSQGNLRAYQLNKDGSVKEIQPGEGISPAPPVRSIDTGSEQIIYGSRDGRPIRIMPKSGGPQTGERPVVNAQGQVIGYEPVSGSELENERFAPVREEVSSLEKIEAALTNNAATLSTMESAIDRMAESGAMYTDEQGIAGRIGAFGQQNLPFVEQVFNPEATTARSDIESGGMDAIMSLRPLLQQAQEAGVTMSSRMMDTPRELELQLQTIINASDEESARTAYTRFRDRYNEALNYVRGRQKELRRRLPAQRQQPRQSQQPSGSPTVSNW